MNILMTNDDGIDSEGLQKLAQVLRERGKYRVFVIAPDQNRSGVSHSLSLLNGPVKLSPLREDTWACSGTPVDCVAVGLMGALPEKPDIVLSGINRGANVGTDIIYSGTAAAARQSSIMGTPAVALSLVGFGGFHWDMAALWAADHLEEFLGFWREDTFVNVNIPNNPDGPAGIVPAWLAVKKYYDTLTVMNAPDGSRFCFFVYGGGGKAAEVPDCEKGSDSDTVSGNFAAISTVCNRPIIRGELCPGAPGYASVAGWETGRG